MASRSILILITVVSLSLFGCRDKAHRSIEMMLALPRQGEPPKGELDFITIIETEKNALVKISSVISEDLPRFYEAEREVNKSEFDKFWSQFERSGLSGSARLTARSPLSDADESWLTLTGPGTNARLDVDALNLFWAGHPASDSRTAAVIEAWKSMKQEIEIPLKPLSRDEVLQIATDCAINWPREVRPVVWEKANSVVAYKGNVNCQAQWK